MAQERMPAIIESIINEHPDLWDAYQKLGEAAKRAGPLDDKSVRLAKLALAIGAKSEGSTRSHVRRNLKAGVTMEEMRQVAYLAIATIGWSSAITALSWINSAEEERKSEPTQDAPAP